MSSSSNLLKAFRLSGYLRSSAKTPFGILKFIKSFSNPFSCVTPGVLLYIYNKKYIDAKISHMINNKVLAKTEENPDETKKTEYKLSSRECRFSAFASVNYNGVPYMTPQDFLESVTKDKPRYRSVQKTVSEKDIADFLYHTPGKHRASKDLFRQMGSNGIISYTEYLFLLCVLTKPESGFRIAFNMFDTDMNQEVDKKEFLVLNKIIGGKLSHEKHSDSDSSGLNALDDIDVDGTQNTTLLTHFFGHKGRDKLNFQNFKEFMENLQAEVLEIEFMEYSRGMKTMSESEFARVLLRYTTVRQDDHEQYVEKIRSKIQREEGITFEDYRKFFLFLNSLDDFTLAMKMYTLADRPISKDEFQQAVKACTGYHLNRHLVETVFHIFDEDGDGHLSYREFVHIMKDRLSRDSSSRQQGSTRWEAYRYCVINKMRDSE